MSGLLDADGAPYDYQAAGAMELLREERRDACEFCGELDDWHTPDCSEHPDLGATYRGRDDFRDAYADAPFHSPYTRHHTPRSTR